jgi:hypothetical protein
MATKTQDLTAGKILSDFLVGKKLRHRNQHGREVVLEIEKAAIDHHSQEDEPATRENDWWPKTTDWTTFTIQFVDGSRKEFSFTSTLDIVD